MAIEDFVNIDRINRFAADGKGGLPATCWNCKTPKMMEWVKQYGDAFWSALKFATLAPSLVKEFSTQLDNRANQDGALPKIIVQICCR